MTELAERAAEILLAAEALSSPGLTDDELDSAEQRYGFTFGVDHRALLRIGLPLRSPDWRDHDDPRLESVDWPVDGMLFDVEHNAYWAHAWGPRPERVSTALDVARSQLATWPRMVPLWGPRFTPSGAGPGAPVLSIIQNDIIFYGDDLVHWAELEVQGRPHDTNLAWDTLLPWSAFAFGEGDRI